MSKRICHYCKKPMYSSNHSVWIKGESYDAHAQCISTKDKPKSWEIKYPDGNILTTNYNPFDEHKENLQKQKENKKLISKWHNMIVTGLVNGLTHTIPDGRQKDINWVRSRGILWEAFGRCVMALEWGNSYEFDERDLKEISEEGYKK